MIEQDVQANILRYLEALGGHAFKVKKANRGGVSDIIGCLPVLITQDMVGKQLGLLATIEVKRDEKDEPTDLQAYHLREFNARGALALVARSVQDVSFAIKHHGLN